MKYLKTYRLYESDEVDYYNGLIKEDIEDMFIDISDMGFQVNVILSKRLVMVDKDWKIGNTRTTFGEIPYIEVRILPIRNSILTSIDVLNRNQNMKSLNNSDDFKTLLDDVNHRISYNDWYVSESRCSDILKVFLHRKQDSKYIK